MTSLLMQRILTDPRYIPPLQIVMFIVGTHGDVQPFIAIGKRLQVIGFGLGSLSILRNNNHSAKELNSNGSDLILIKGTQENSQREVEYNQSRKLH